MKEGIPFNSPNHTVGQFMSKRKKHHRKHTPNVVASWEMFEAVHKETSKELLDNTIIIRGMLANPLISRNIGLSKGIETFEASIIYTINSLTERLSHIHSLHKDKKGVITENDDDVNTVFDLHSSYNEFSSLLANDFVLILQTLKQLQDGPVEFGTPDDVTTEQTDV